MVTAANHIDLHRFDEAEKQYNFSIQAAHDASFKLPKVSDVNLGICYESRGLLEEADILQIYPFFSQNDCNYSYLKLFFTKIN